MNQLKELLGGMILAALIGMTIGVALIREEQIQGVQVVAEAQP